MLKSCFSKRGIFIGLLVLMWTVNTMAADTAKEDVPDFSAMTDNEKAQRYGRGQCFRRQDGNLSNSNHDIIDGGECTEEMFSGLKLGEWITRLADSDIRGASVCSNMVPPIVDKVIKQQVDEDTLNYYNTLSFHDLGFVATDDSMDTLDSQWISQMAGKVLDVDMFYCWCKSYDENTRWVYSDAFGIDSGVNGDSSFCATFCAQNCANRVRLDAEFRDVVLEHVTP